MKDRVVTVEELESYCKNKSVACKGANIEPLKQNDEKIMDELKEIKSDIKELTRVVLTMPSSIKDDIREESNVLYASKKVEDDIEKLKEEKSKSISYWLDQIVRIVSSILLAYVGFKLFR